MLDSDRNQGDSDSNTSTKVVVYQCRLKRVKSNIAVALAGVDVSANMSPD